MSILSFYATLLLIVTVVYSGLAVYVWPRRQVPGHRAFAGLMLTGAWWALTSALEALAWNLSTEVWISKIAYLGKEGVPVFFLLFALQYTGLLRPLPKRVLAWLWVVPVLTVGMVFTNEAHRLFWSQIYPASQGPAGVYVYEHGLWFWVAFGYNYLLLLAGSSLLLVFAMRRAQFYRRQGAALLLGVAFSWLGNLLYVSGLAPRGADLTPGGGVLGGAIFV
jgi:hypothetical protein